MSKFQLALRFLGWFVSTITFTYIAAISSDGYHPIVFIISSISAVFSALLLLTHAFAEEIDGGPSDPDAQA